MMNRVMRAMEAAAWPFEIYDVIRIGGTGRCSHME